MGKPCLPFPISPLPGVYLSLFHPGPMRETRTQLRVVKRRSIAGQGMIGVQVMPTWPDLLDEVRRQGFCIDRAFLQKRIKPFDDLHIQRKLFK